MKRGWSTKFRIQETNWVLEDLRSGEQKGGWAESLKLVLKQASCSPLLTGLTQSLPALCLNVWGGHESRD